MEYFNSINPYTQEISGEYPLHSKAEISHKIDLAARIFRSTRFSDRVSCMVSLEQLLLKDSEKLSLLITSEMGKVLRESQAEIEKCAATIRYYTTHAETFLRPVEVPGSNSFIRFDPLGPVLAIMPWNFPFWQAMRFAIPAVIAGNTVLLKHAPNVTGCALAIEQLFLSAGFPEGVFQTLVCDTDLAEMIISSPAVCGVTLTGSNSAGSAVGQLAGKYLKKSVLELGGSDAFIVLKDADIRLAAETAVKSRFQNAGQTCIAAKRWIIESDIFDAFCEEVLQRVQALKQGDPLDPSTDIGPLARTDIATRLARQIRTLQRQQHHLLLGGTHSGCNFQPSVILMNPASKDHFDEETFGPLACLFAVKDAEEALQTANNSIYGLGASLWTADPEKADKIAEKLESGFVAINGMVRSEAGLPFGGIKQSGYGRELSYFGMHEFMNIKSVWKE